jgi:hypothetical protein
MYIYVYIYTYIYIGMHQAAARNYHSATIYFRVLESMVPRLSSRVHASLNYAAARTQQSSHLLENLVHEHFEGLRCVDFYEILENRRLGKVFIHNDIYVYVFNICVSYMYIYIYM